MSDWISEHADTLKIVAGVLVGLWLLGWVTKRRKNWHGADVTAYCKNCNWEGKVAQNRMVCGKCKSTNIQTK